MPRHDDWVEEHLEAMWHRERVLARWAKNLEITDLKGTHFLRIFVSFHVGRSVQIGGKVMEIAGRMKWRDRKYYLISESSVVGVLRAGKMGEVRARYSIERCKDARYLIGRWHSGKPKLRYLMASMKKQARASSSSGSEGNAWLQPVKKEHSNSAGVLELSVTIGYLGADVKVHELEKLELLLHEHCDAGLVAIERGDMESHLHFQMVVRARVSSARAFGILYRKYMDWHGVRNMSLAGKVTCKVLSNRLIHTFKGMIGYCLKDSGASHFAVAMHNISDDDVIAGKTLHAIYGRADLNRRVTLTNKNVTERMYVWYKYKENRQLIATFLSTLTDLVRSGMFMPAASWIIPMSGQGMEARRMKSLWHCIVDPSNVDKDVVGDVFVRKREYVRGRYHKLDDDDDSNPDSLLSEEEGRTLLKLCLKSSLDRVVRFKEEPPSIGVPCKKPEFSDQLGNFIPLRNQAALVIDEFLQTADVLLGHNVTTVKTEPEFWEALLPKPSPSLLEKRSKGKAAIDPFVDVICLSSDEEEGPLLNDRPLKRRLIKVVDK